MDISRSGYYNWLKTRNILNRYEINRKELGELIIQIYNRKPSYGYHRIRKIIIDETGWIISDNLVYKVCKLLNIKSKAIRNQVRNQLNVVINFIDCKDYVISLIFFLFIEKFW